MTKVEIIQMGPPNRDLNLRKVERIANKAQHHFRFVLVDPINHLGQPNDDGEYEVGNLAALLENRPTQNGADCKIGVTDAPLCEGFFSGVDKAVNNIVISVAAPIEELVRTINRSNADYVLLEIAAQLLTVEYRRQTTLSVEPEECGLPWHEETKSCVFDYCGHPPHTLKKLMTPKLCPECRALLEFANIRDSVIEACMDIVEKAASPKFWNVVKGVLSDPFGRALFGGLFLYLVGNLLTSIGFSGLQVAGLVLALLLAVILRQLRRQKQLRG